MVCAHNSLYLSLSLSLSPSVSVPLFLSLSLSLSPSVCHSLQAFWGKRFRHATSPHNGDGDEEVC
jgi:hypothetical protein